MKRLSYFALPLLILAILTNQLPAADSPKTFTVGGLNFNSPTDWTWVATTSPMRKAQFSAAGSDGAAEVVFFHFGKGQGGSVQANIDRWLGQFAEPKDQLKTRTEKKTPGTLEITYVFAEGTYLSGPPFGQKTPVKNQALVGAIITDEDGDVFVKMTGPKTTTDKAEAAFKKMVESAKR
jgi:hypothetical protein